MSGIFTPFTEKELLPQEERLEVLQKKGSFAIGIPKENQTQEKRIGLTPDAVSILSALGHEIVIESGAGIGSHYKDSEYSEAGAKIAYDAKEVFSQHVILKVQPLNFEEIKLLQQGAIVISAVQLSMLNKENILKMTEKRITAFGYEYIKDSHGILSLVRLIGEIAGINSILLAAELLTAKNNGNALLLGNISGVRPTEVVIIGAGTVGEHAARTALGLGASVRIFDNSLTRLRRLQDLMQHRISTSLIDPKELSKALRRCDVAIGALRGVLRSPTVVSEQMVENMKAGSVIIDVSIDTGGCFETSRVTTHEHPTFIKHDVIHYCVNNTTSRVSRTTSKALSNYFSSFLIEIAEKGGFESFIQNNMIIREGIYMYQGRIVKKQISDWYDLPYRDINLLIV